MDETALEVWPFDAPERAVRFLTFLHEEAEASDVDLEPAPDGRYRFRVSSPSSTVIAALLGSSEFFPQTLHSSASGPLAVQLGPSQPGLRPARAESFSSNNSSGSRPAAEPDAGSSSLLQAFEHLDQALDDGGEERTAP